MKWKNSISDFKPPTQQDLEINKRYIQECERLGIETGWFGEQQDFYTQDELKAMSILITGKKISRELEDRLLATKQQRLSRHGLNSEEFSNTDTEAAFNEFMQK